MMLLTEAERWKPGQLSHVWSLEKPKQHYTVCNELGLLLDLKVALLQQLGTVAGSVGRSRAQQWGEGSWEEHGMGS